MVLLFIFASKKLSKYILLPVLFDVDGRLLFERRLPGLETSSDVAGEIGRLIRPPPCSEGGATNGSVSPNISPRPLCMRGDRSVVRLEVDARRAEDGRDLLRLVVVVEETVEEGVVAVVGEMVACLVFLMEGSSEDVD